MDDILHVKRLALLVLLASAAIVRADDAGNLLKNGDFSGGIAPWQGDITPATLTSGALVKLGADWSKVSQVYNATTGDYTLTVKYAVTSGSAFSTDPHMYGNVSNRLAIPGVGGFGSQIGQWVILLYNPVSSSFWRLTPRHGSAAQIFTARVHLKADTDNNDTSQNLLLAFPPGTGTVNLLSISLVPATGTAH